MLLGESRRLQGRKEAHVTSRQARAVAGLAFRDQSPPSESAPAAWAQRNPRPGAFGVKKRTLNSPFQKPNFSSSWLGNASDVRHLHSNPADFKHFPFWARSSESGNEFPTPFSPRRSPASNLSAVPVKWFTSLRGEKSKGMLWRRNEALSLKSLFMGGERAKTLPQNARLQHQSDIK